jgi:hypothetical protein
MRGLIIGMLSIGAATIAVHTAVAQQPPMPTYRGNGYFEDNTYSKKVPRGYSGWSAPPIRGYFCDYRKYPVRECNGGRCRTAGWRLQQYCY